MWLYNTKRKGRSDNMDKIIIKGARENNLKNINIELPKNKLIVMTGVSWSQVKSSLHLIQFMLKAKEDMLKVYLLMLDNF